MRTLETGETLSLPNTSGSRWKRIILGAVLSDIGVLGMLTVVILTHRFVLAPGLTAAAYDEFAQTAGYYVAPPAAAVATFVFAYWVAARLGSGFVRNGLLVGVVATLPTLGFVLGAKPEHRLMYMISYTLRIVAGYCGGLAAQNTNGASGGHTRQVH